MNRTLLLMTLLGVRSLSLAMFGVGVRSNTDELSEKARLGLSLAPLPLDLQGKDCELVGLGSYLVNAVASC